MPKSLRFEERGGTPNAFSTLGQHLSLQLNCAPSPADVCYIHLLGRQLEHQPSRVALELGLRKLEDAAKILS